MHRLQSVTVRHASQAELQALRDGRQRLLEQALDLKAGIAERDSRVAQLQHQLARAQLAAKIAEVNHAHVLGAPFSEFHTTLLEMFTCWAPPHVEPTMPSCGSSVTPVQSASWCVQTAQAAAESAAAELQRAADINHEQQEAAAVVEGVVQQLEAGAAAQQGATAPQPMDAEVAAAAAAVLTEAAVPAASDRVTASPTADTHSQAHAPLPTPFHLKVRLMLLFKCWPRTQVAMAAPVACCNHGLQC